MRYFRLTFVLVVTLVTLAGCVWSRLYDTKQQLADFDNHFKVKVTDHFVLQFQHPLLRSEDLIYLSELKPGKETVLPWGGKRWSHRFRKLTNAGQVARPPADIVFEMQFDSTDRLMAWDFSPTFLAMAPPDFLELSFRSLGQARIFESSRQLKADVSKLPKSKAPLPSRADVLKVLGSPTAREDGPDASTDIYRFKVDSLPVHPDATDVDKRLIATAKLRFDPKTERLTKLSSDFVGLKFSINYLKLTETDSASN